MPKAKGYREYTRGQSRHGEQDCQRGGLESRGRSGVNAKRNNHRPADPATNLESHPVHAAKGAHAAEKLHTPVRITIHSIRRKLADSDGISGKACIDGIVKAGLLDDDSTEFVSEVRYTQEKTDGAEKTVVTLTTEQIFK